MTGFGNYEDMKCVDDYARQNGLKRAEIWDIIKRANYAVIVERGLMDRKKVNENERE